MNLARAFFLTCCIAATSMTAWAQPAPTEAPSAAEAPTEKTPTLEEWIERAKAARKAGKLAEAVLALEKATELQKHPVLLHNLARLYEELGRYSDAYNVYRTVADDPRAPAAARALTSSRLANIRSKLGHAWVVLKVKGGKAKLLIDGKRPERDPTRPEIRMGPGLSLFELLDKAGRQNFVRFPDYPMGERTPMTVDLAAAGASDATVKLGPVDPSPARIVINGLELGADPHHYDQLRLEAGSYTLEISRLGFEDQRFELTLKAGDTRSIQEVLLNAKPVGGILEDTGPGPWPMVTLGTGSAVMVIGTGLLISATIDRSDIVDAETRDDGVITGLSQLDAADLNDGLGWKSTVGWTTFGMGIATALGGVLWWWLTRSDEDSDEESAGVKIVPSLSGVGVSF